MADSVRKILADTRALLHFQEDMGLTDLPLTPELKKFLAKPEAAAPAGGSPVPRPPAAYSAPAPPPAATPRRPKPMVIPGNAQPIGEIHQELAGCRLCLLHETRDKLVPGSGSSLSRLLVIEEQPGEAEETARKPLAGEAGELFDKMLQAIGLKREQVYLTSLVKCRPPADREASETEIHTCQSYLFRQIAAVNPAVICGLGPLTAKILTGSQQPLFRLRGRFHDFHGTPLLVTFHPNFLLRNQEMKKASWQDLQLIQKKLANAKP
ncbi:MAG: uracil-DNA glycosylase [Desulfobulbaceae bacterium]|nr:uracil-DNA glycosylase [Desulfobulbaceae bacterium]